MSYVRRQRLSWARIKLSNYFRTINFVLLCQTSLKISSMYTRTISSIFVCLPCITRFFFEKYCSLLPSSSCKFKFAISWVFLTLFISSFLYTSYIFSHIFPLGLLKDFLFTFQCTFSCFFLCFSQSFFIIHFSCANVNTFFKNFLNFFKFFIV